jgi:hypothetical protein
MSAAAVQVRMPHPRPFAWVRRTAPRLTLRSTATGWGLYDDAQRLIFEAEGAAGRLACLRRAFALGVVRVRAGEEPSVA